VIVASGSMFAGRTQPEQLLNHTSDSSFILGYPEHYGMRPVGMI